MIEGPIGVAQLSGQRIQEMDRMVLAIPIGIFPLEGDLSQVLAWLLVMKQQVAGYSLKKSRKATRWGQQGEMFNDEGISLVAKV